MKLEEKIQILQFCSAVFNTIFLILGLSVCGCAVWILFDKGSFLAVFTSEELKTVAGGLLIIGVVVVAVSAVGCLGARGENRFFLLTYMAVLLVLVLGQLFVMLVLVVSQDKIERSLDDAVQEIIIQYGNSSESQDRLLDKVQHYTKCCGLTGPADWQKNSFIMSVNLTNPAVLPCSCFSSPRCPLLQGYNTPLFGRGNNSYEKGCKEKISVWLEENALTIVGMDVSLMLIQVVQFVLAVYLYRAIGQKASLKGISQLFEQDEADLDQNEDYMQYGEQNLGYIDPNYDYIDPAYPGHYHDNHNHIDPAHPAHPYDNHDYLETTPGYQ